MSDDTTKNPNVNDEVDEDEEEDDDFDTGLDRLRGAMAKDKDRFESYKLGGVFRECWLKPGEEAQVRFFTEKPYALGRHSYYLNGRWRQSTCRSKKTGGNPKVCPMCTDPDIFKLRDEGAHLLTDRREFPSKENKVYTNELKILCFSSKHIIKIQ